MGLELLCSGYVASIDETNEEIIFDKECRFEKIPLQLAQDFIRQNNDNNIPICVQHQESLVIGVVTSLYIKSIPSYDVDGKWGLSTLLVCDFSITNQNFIHTLQYVTHYKYIKQFTPYISSDNFVYSNHSCNDLTDEVIDVNAYLSLTQKFAGLSIGHDTNILRVKEISICVAGYRQLCLIRSVNFHKNIDLCSDINPKEVDKYKTLFAANFSLSIANSSEKVKQDLIRLNLPKHCLVYTYPEMYRVNEEQFKKSKNNDKDMDTGDNAEQRALNLLQTILKKHFKEEEDEKDQNLPKKSNTSEEDDNDGANDDDEDDEEEIREFIRQKRLNRKRKYQTESTSNSDKTLKIKPKPISVPYGYPCIFEPPPQTKEMDALPIQNKQYYIPSKALEYQYQNNKLKKNNDDNKTHDTKQQIQSAVSILHKLVYEI